MNKIPMLAVLAAALTANAQFTVRPWTQDNEPLVDRVAADFKGVNAYKAEKVARTSGFTGGQESVFEFWKDAELGDPAFYEAVVKPLEERLDKGLEKVKVGMSDEDVRDVAQNYLQEWRDLRFTVGRLRAAYLNERLSEEGR